jgi:hypothetical protein
VEVGAEVRIDGFFLVRVRVRSNVGSNTFWSFSDAAETTFVFLDEEVGGDRYMHGDFNCPLHGPNRSDVIAFAQRAPRFVEALIAREEGIAKQLDAAEANIASASRALEGVISAH